MSVGTPAWIRRGVLAYRDPVRGLEDCEEDPPTVVWLVPIGGGCEWRADINLVQPARR